MAFTHLLLGSIVASFFLLQPLHALSTTCSTASTSLTSSNITISDGSFSCSSVQQPKSHAASLEEATLNCSMKVIFDSSTDHTITSDATYLCSAAATANRLTTSSSAAANCSGLFNTFALNVTATDIDGVSSCSLEITTAPHNLPQNSDFNTTVDCITITTTTSPVNDSTVDTTTTANVTSLCSVVTFVRSGPTITRESVATTKCTSLASTSIIAANHTSITKAVGLCSIESTSHPNTSDSFFHGAIFPHFPPSGLITTL